MTPNWPRVRELAERAFELPHDERESFVIAVCAEDEGLRDAVLALVRADPVFDRRLDRDPKGVLEASTRELFGLSPGTRLGPWEIRSEVASGGMGTVYEASRADEQFEMRVAIKVIKAGMDSAEVVRRFQTERQVLAEIDHPGIARLLDGGMTPLARPYLVMEYVEGEPIDDYCRARHLGVADRIRLFLEVCSAVHAAHQALIVHRDLKPSNILVTAAGEPKLLDFGIAKVLDPERVGAVQVTLECGRAMTPEYASPEQIRGDLITTATDVYGLGVVLFELLTDTRAFTFAGHTWSEIERAVLERELPLASSGASRSAARSIVGDLDNVIAKAVSKDPKRRYSSALQLADDLRNHLAGLPVVARPDTFAYRASRFATRNKGGVFVGVTTFTLLWIALIYSRTQYREAVDAHRLAERRFGEVRTLARTYLDELDPMLADLGGATKARRFVVDTALGYLGRLLQEVGDDVALRLEVADGYLRVGDVQGGPLVANLGDGAAALESYRTSMSVLEGLDDRSRSTPEARGLLALCHHRIGAMQEASGSLDAARSHYVEAGRLVSGIELDERGDGLRETLLQVDASRITVAMQRGDLEEALSLAESHITLARDLSAGSSRALGMVVAPALVRSAQVLGSCGNAPLAEEQLREAVDLARTALRDVNSDASSEPIRRSLSFALGTLANSLQLQGRDEECIEVLREQLTLARDGVRRDADDVQARRYLFAGLLTLGQSLVRVARDDGDPRLGEALEVAREQVEVADRLIEVSPSNLRFRHDRIGARITLTRALVRNHRAAEGVEECRVALEEALELVASRGEDAEAERAAATVRWDLGKALRANAREVEDLRIQHEILREARDTFEQGVTQLRQLLEQGRLPPVLEPYVARWQGDVDETDRLIEALEGAVEVP